MRLLNALLPTEQRRMKIGLIALAINYTLFALGIVAIFMGKNFDFSDIGTGLALVNVPVLTVIIGESIRPTGFTTNTTTTTSSNTAEAGVQTQLTTNVKQN